MGFFTYLGWAILIIFGLFIALLVWLIKLPFKLAQKDREQKRREEEDRKKREREAERERRKNTPCLFEDGFSEEEFEQMAIHASRKIKRLRVEVSGPIVYGTVQSQTGISEWNFKVDFNDYGHVTGMYWLSSDNYDSSIPKGYADRLSGEIKDFNLRIPPNQKRCSKCGQIFMAGASICPYCGFRVS